MATPLGLSLPIRRGKNGFFEQTFDTLSVAKNNLKTLMLTRKGEIPMTPQFGTDLYSVLFEHNIDDVEEIVSQTIIDEVAAWLPYINIQNIEFDRDGQTIDLNRLFMKIHFTVGDTSNVETLTIGI
jgi:phage baseplate assembly protein W